MSLLSRRILIIDQNENTGQALQTLIAAWGYDVLIENSVAPSLESILKSDPTVVVDSNSLTADESFSVLHDLKSQQSGVPVILLAESTSVDNAKRAVKE